MRETLIGCLLIHALTGDGTHNLGMCPDQEIKPVTFWPMGRLQPMKPHWPGQVVLLILGKKTFIFNLVYILKRVRELLSVLCKVIEVSIFHLY